MKSVKSFVPFLFLVFYVTSFAQQELHRWKKLDIPDKKIWYDESGLDTSNAEYIEVWVLQQHTPPLTIKELPGTIYRSKTLYVISLRTAKYGIEKVIYYDSSDKELYNFDYKITGYPDKYKYSYPVLADSFLHKILKEYFKKKVSTNN